MNKDDRANIIEIWKTVVEVQQHFNDIEMKIRGLFITIIVAIAAAQGFLLERRLSIPFGRVSILYATVLPWLGVVATYLFYFIDRHWYHRLLLGAVLQGAEIEEKYRDVLPELGLGAKISEKSPVELKNWFGRKVADWVVSDEKYKQTGKLHSDAKIELLYKSVVWLFIVWAILTALFAGILVDDKSLFEFWTHKIALALCGPN